VATISNGRCGKHHIHLRRASPHASQRKKTSLTFRKDQERSKQAKSRNRSSTCIRSASQTSETLGRTTFPSPSGIRSSHNPGPPLHYPNPVVGALLWLSCSTSASRFSPAESLTDARIIPVPIRYSAPKLTTDSRKHAHAHQIVNQ
jgi:hypothetical protein